MPKAKPKVPKTEKMWMAWNEVEGFIPEVYELRKKALPKYTMYGDYRRVRIVPEAEYQRMRKALNHFASVGNMVKIGDFTLSNDPPIEGKVWINRESGEGGSFDLEKFEKHIEAFYQEHF